MIGENFDDYGYNKQLRKKAIADRIDAEEKEVYDSISSLEELGLIDEPPPGRESTGFRLTKKGFEIAHEMDRRQRAIDREQRQGRRQHEINRAIGLLTLGLLVVGLIQAIISGIVGAGSTLIELNLMIVAGVGVTGIVVYLLFREGLLTR